MKKIYKLFFVFFLLFIYSSLNAQAYRKPLCVLETTFSYAQPSFDFSGSSLKNFYNFTDYGIKGGYNANLTSKFSVANFKVGQVRAYLTIAFAEFLGSDDRAYNIGGFIKAGWPKTGIKDSLIPYVPPTDTAGSSSITIHSPYIAVGWEIAFFTDRNRKSIITFGTDFDIAVLWGKIYDQPSGKKEIYNNLLDNTKLGLGLNLGYTYRLDEAFGLTFGTRLQFTNLFKKKSDFVKDDGDIFLNDAADVNLNKLLNNNRTIGFIGFYGGLSFFIGTRK